MTHAHLTFVHFSFSDLSIIEILTIGHHSKPTNYAMLLCSNIVVVYAVNYASLLQQKLLSDSPKYMNSQKHWYAPY